MAHPAKVRGWVDEFRGFIMRGNVVGCAAFTAVVNSLAKPSR